MGRIQSSIGLITGVPIADTVDKLIALSARPRDLIQARTKALQDQQVAIGELTALTIAIQLSANKLGESGIFKQRTVSSSNEALLAAAVTGDPTPGIYQYTPIRMAQNHQLISDGVASLDQPIGAGQLGVRFGGFVDRGLNLELLNGGAGVQRGKIRITDRSGASDVIDLRYAVTVDDVIAAINGSDQINVSAVADGDSFGLIDHTGQSVANLQVQEVGFGTTAADLGLDGINVAASVATGQDVLSLFSALPVSLLNDGTGLSIREELPDLQISFRDGSAPLEIDLKGADITTLGDLVDALNAADPARLQAAISSDGDRLVLTDLTADTGGTFAVSSAVGGTLAEDLGLTGTAVGGVLTGGRVLGGLKAPLLSSLAGGAGLGTLGQISLTDRNGAAATVDLSSAETLSDVVDLINGAAVAITASVNEARNGIVLTDTTGATTSNLIVANADATNTADKLGLTIDAAQDSVDSGSLSLQVLHEATTLASLNHGQGVASGSFLVTDSAGNASGVNLVTAGIETVGQLIEAINGLGIGVTARINDTGDGLLLIDTAGGPGKLTVEESGSGTTAADLGILGESVLVDINGTPTEVIDGATSQTLAIDAADTLQDIVDKINAADLGVKAGIFQTGSGVAPYRIALISETPGKDGEILLDTSQLGIGFHEIVAAQDAALLVGSADIPGAGVIATSSSNRFDNVIDGVQLTVGGVSETPVTIEVKESNEDLVSSLNLLVDQYNKLQDKLEELTFFNESDGSTGILFGSNETLRIETTLSNLLTGRLFGAGDIQSLEELGLSVDDQGKLALDEDKLQQRIDEDPAAVEQFFTDKEFGFATRMNAAIESLAGEGNSLLVSRNEALQNKIEQNNERIDFLTARLDVQRERLLNHFYLMETAIAKIQSNLSAIQSLAALPPITSSNKST